MIVHNVIQGTDEWFKMRQGKMTASHAQAIASAGKGLETYILEMMSEKFSTGEREQYSNKDTERGVDLEDMARSMYELENDCNVKEVGFVEFNEFVGCSPDGLVDDEGLIEIKCVKDKNHFKLLLDNKIESKYTWQMQMQMLVTERKWCDYVSYNPNFKQSIIKIRVERDVEKIEKLIIGLNKGVENIKEILNTIK